LRREHLGVPSIGARIVHAAPSGSRGSHPRHAARVQARSGLRRRRIAPMAGKCSSQDAQDGGAATQRPPAAVVAPSRPWGPLDPRPGLEPQWLHFDPRYAIVERAPPVRGAWLLPRPTSGNTPAAGGYNARWVRYRHA
jgi:hypothetical protein